jgi:uncharacterized membrane protein YjfL (UPF0719 family)
MNKFIIIIIVVIALVLGVFFMLPVTQYNLNKMINPQNNTSSANNANNSNQALTIEDVDDDKIEELLSAFDNCDLITENFSHNAYELEGKIIGKAKEKCQVVITLTNAPGLEALAIGSSANCNLSRQELENLKENFDLEGLDCSGPLFDLAKTFMS